MTLNSGRIQINLKPREQRHADATDIIRRLQPSAAERRRDHALPAAGAGPHRRRPRQPHAVSVHPGGCRRARNWPTWTPRLVDKLKALPELRDVASDQQNDGLADHARHRSRHRLAPGRQCPAIDDTLYDAFGQRQVSTMFTQLNQYHVILEVEAGLPARSRRAQEPLRRVGHGAAGAAQLLHPASSRHHAARHQSPGSVSRRHPLLQPRARRLAGRRRRRHQERGATRSACPRACRPASRAPPQAFQASLANEPLLILAALVTVYIVLGVLYESYIHPVTILSTLPSAGVGAILALLLFRIDLGVIALIGIILLIGIVKKNAIMMIDFALEAEREGGQASRGGHLPGLPPALPPHHDDHHGRAARRPAARPRHGHRLGAASPARHHHRRRPDRLPDRSRSTPRPWSTSTSTASPGDSVGVTHPGTLPTPARARTRRRRDEHLRALHSPPGRDLAAERSRCCSPASWRYRLLPVASLPEVEFPTIQVQASPARCQPGDHGLRRGYAARTSVRTHRRRHPDDLHQPARGSTIAPAVRSQPQYRRRRARRAGRHQRRTQPASRQPAPATRPIAKSTPPTRRS